MTIMENQYYGNKVKESADVKEYLSIEIKGDKQLYRLSFNYRQQKKQTFRSN